MNWFQRYGIPGAYFVALIATWAYLSYPQIMQCYNPSVLVALIVIGFLPIGYIISVVEQLIYLSWRRYLTRWRNLRGWLGVHGAAMDRLKVAFLGFRGDEPIQDEAIIEARTLLLTALADGIPVSTHRYVRDWIARRADVSAINLSLIVANVFAIFVALTALCISGKWLPPVILLAFCILVISVMVCSIRVLRRQIVEVISGIYRRYRRIQP